VAFFLPQTYEDNYIAIIGNSKMQLSKLGNDGKGIGPEQGLRSSTLKKI
jgi:hypothetical protein